MNNHSSQHSTRGGEVRNTLFYGDNLGILRHHIASESVDLVYLNLPNTSNVTPYVQLATNGLEE